MQLITACGIILDQLEDVVTQISSEDFAKPSPALSNSTVGQHVRHTIEFFICLETGFREGVINYDKRAHDKLIESDKFLALNAIRRIKDFTSTTGIDTGLKLNVGYERDTEDCVTIQTNYFRELAYNIEHAVHHMALIKIAVREIADYVELPDDFGIAVSTLRHKDVIHVEK
jgi:uncharacterized damage-inducible protein DinB